MPLIAQIILLFSSCAGESGSSEVDDLSCVPSRLLVTTSDGRVGELATLEPESQEIVVASASNDDPDTVPALMGCTPVLLERSRGRIKLQSQEDPLVTDALIDVNPNGMRGQYQADPLRVVQITPSKAYAVLGQVNELVIFNPQTAAITGTVNLSALAFETDLDGLVDVLDAIKVGDVLYVALGQYWFESDESGQVQRIVFGGSEVAMIDTQNDELLDADPSTRSYDGIALEFDNPARGMISDGQTLWVVAPGKIGAGQPVLDGGIEAISLASSRSIGPMITEATLGMDISNAIRVEEARWLIQLGAELWSLDPARPEERRLVTQGVQQMRRVESSVYVWAGPGPSEGLRRFDLESEAETTSGPTPWFVGDLPVSAIAGIP